MAFAPQVPNIDIEKDVYSPGESKMRTTQRHIQNTVK